MTARLSGIVGLILSAWCLGGCQAPPAPAYPIVLHPPSERPYNTAVRRSSTKKLPPGTAALCDRSTVNLTHAQQEQIFRQFDAEQGQTAPESTIALAPSATALAPATLSPRHGPDTCRERS